MARLIFILVLLSAGHAWAQPLEGARTWILSRGGLFSSPRLDTATELLILLARPAPELTLEAQSPVLLTEPMTPVALPEEHFPADLLERERETPAAARLRLGWLETFLGVEGRQPVWNASLSRGGIRTSARGAIDWLGSWRRYEVEYTLRICEGLSFAARATRRVQAEMVEDTGGGSLRWNF